MEVRAGRMREAARHNSMAIPQRSSVLDKLQTKAPEAPKTVGGVRELRIDAVVRVDMFYLVREVWAGAVASAAPNHLRDGAA